MAPVRIRTPTVRDELRFIEAVRRSRSLHGRWVQPPHTAMDFRAFVQRARQSPSHESRLVIDTATRGLVGVVNLNEIVRGSFRSAYLGYYAFEASAGRGLMSAGLALVLREAFGPLGLHRVEANIQPENTRSIALVRRHGFRCEGFSPRYLKIAGRWRDHERWALLREEWRART